MTKAPSTDPSTDQNTNAWPRTDLLHDLFRAWATVQPDATAVVDGDTVLTYRDLNRWSDTHAGELAARGVGPGTIVPVLLPSTPTLISVLIAVLKTGAAYSILDTNWPHAMLRGAVARLGRDLVGVVGPLPDDAIAADDMALTYYDLFPRIWTPSPPFPMTATPPPKPLVSVPPTLPPTSLVPGLTGSHTAMVFFTSGTTGEPKAVLSPHQGTARLLHDCPFARLGPGTVMPQLAAAPWDAFALEVWGTLATGGTCVLPPERPVTPDGLRDLIRVRGVNTVFLTTSLFHLLVEEDPRAFDGLDTVMVGGERLDPRHAARFATAFPGIRLVNGYGPAESTVFALYHDVRDPDPTQDVPLGRPVPRTAVHVMDGDRICGPGEVGELCISGDGLASGYLGDPDATSARFVDRLIDGHRQRVYLTGDRGYTADDGTIRFAGRGDRQVKVRGHRVEPAGIERVAGAIGGVLRAVVVPVASAGAGPSATASASVGGAGAGADGGWESLALFYRREQDGPSEAELATALRERLPAYSVPRTVVEVADFPLTPHGKLDVRALTSTALPTASPDGGKPVVPSERPSASVPVLDLVIDAFGDVLGSSQPDPDAPFFALGGTSLSAVRLCTRLTTAFGRTIPVSQLMRTPTARELSAWLALAPANADMDADAGTQTAPGPVTEVPTAEVPLTAMQASFLVAHLDPVADAANHCLLGWELVGPVDPAALAAAVGDVHRRHGYLRARYDLADGIAIDPGDTSAEFHRLDVAYGEPQAELMRAESVQAELLRAESMRDALLRVLMAPFDLADGRVWRAALVPAGPPDRWYFGVSVHHIAFDGHSEHILARDLALAYAARSRGVEPRFPGVALDLARAAAALRSTVPAAELAGQRDYWARTLADVQALDLGPAQADGRPAPVLEIALSPGTIARIDRAAQRMATGRLTVLLHAVAGALGSTTGQWDFGLGVPVGRRISEAVQHTVGCMIDTMCVRVRLGDLDDPARFARGVAEHQAHSDLPFAEVVQACGVRGGPRRTALYQAMAAVQDSPEPVLSLPGVEARPLLLESGAAPPVALAVELFPAGRPRLRVSADPAVVREALVSELAAAVIARLEAPLSGP